MKTIRLARLAPKSMVTALAPLWLIMACPGAHGQSSVVVTAAGQPGLRGYVDAQGSAARFNFPAGAVVDATGNLYVADGLNNAIRKIAPDGTTSTFAGGQSGTADGTGTNAAFNFPAGLAIDSAGNLYVADEFNNKIRKITPAGVVTSLAGGGGRGRFANGTGTNAFFNHPSGVAVDNGGNVYVADTLSCMVRMVSPGGVVTTVAGSANALGGTVGSTDGPGASALFNYPVALALDGSTNLYVADTANSTIRMITPAAVVSTVAGTAGSNGILDGQSTNAQFAYPEGIAVAGSGALYVADSGNHTIRIVSPSGAVTTLAGQAGKRGGTEGAGTNALFYRPQALALDATANVYVADALNDSIRVVGTNGATRLLAGPGGSSGSDSGTGTAARFNYPAAVASDVAGNLYVADLLNFVVRKITPEGTASVLAGQPGQSGFADGPGTNALFAGPSGLAVDSAGNIYVADADNDTIRMITPAGVVSTVAGQSGVAGYTNGPGGSAAFNNPEGLAIDSAGNLYVADTGNNLIREVVPSPGNWVVRTLAGSGTNGAADGVGTNASFNAPAAVAVDAAGNIYVADTVNKTIRVIATNGAVSTLAGLAGQGGSQDGTGNNASFSIVSGLAVDLAGNLYVADTGNETIRQVTPSGVVTTLAGAPDEAGSVDGLGAAVRFSLPTGITATPSGDVYVTDALNNTLRIGLRTPLVGVAAGTGGVTVSWPGPLSGFLLETSASVLPGSAWSVITNDFGASGVRNVLTNQAGDAMRFYRLRGL